MNEPGKDNKDERGGPEKRDLRAFKSRLDALEGRLETVRERRQAHAAEPGRERASAMGRAFRLSVDMIAGVVVGGAIGWGLDQWLGTAPLMLIMFLLLGSAAGILNAVRTAQQMQAETMRERAPEERHGSDNDKAG